MIDTLQKIRLLRKNENPYANDYNDAGALKKFADKHGLSVLVIHHTRKMSDSDPFNTISGSTGLTGAVDNMYVIQKQSRTSQDAVFHATGRDIDPQELAIRFDENKTWQLISEDAEAYLEQKTFEENPLFILCERLLADMAEFKGTASQLHPLLATRIKASEDFRFPLSGQALSRELTTIQNKLKEKGIIFKRDPDTSKRHLILKKVPLVPLDSACNTENTAITGTSAIPAQLNVPLESSDTNDSSATSGIPAEPCKSNTPLKDSNINTSSATSVTSANSYIDSLFSSVGLQKVGNYMHPLKEEYNKYITVENKIGSWLDDPNIPLEEKEPRIPQYQELTKKLSELLNRMTDEGLCYTDSEALYGFKE